MLEIVIMMFLLFVVCLLNFWNMQALKVLARALEANPSSAVLWVVYLHVYYSTEMSIGKDDMFLFAVCCYLSCSFYLFIVIMKEEGVEDPYQSIFSLTWYLAPS